jgi:F0F1-type ATP synthase gamma subunit
MSNKKKLTTDMAVLHSIDEIVGSYEEIAAMRMRKVKKSVLQTRDFISGLNDAYQRVWYTYRLQASKKTFGVFNAPKGTLETNNKNVSVLVSANTGLYGDIIKKTFQLFMDNIVGGSTDIVILGRVGRQLFDSAATGMSYKYFDLSDSGSERESLKPVVEYITPYSNIMVYHGIYVSVLTQDPKKTYVTGKIMNIKSESDRGELQCLIEPSIEAVTTFFEKQILATIFEQTMFEASLSKFASRMISLDMASENIHVATKKAKFQMLKLRHSINNSKQTERLSGIALWS